MPNIHTLYSSRINPHRLCSGPYSVWPREKSTLTPSIEDIKQQQTELQSLVKKIDENRERNTAELLAKIQEIRMNLDDPLVKTSRRIFQFLQSMGSSAYQRSIVTVNRTQTFLRSHQNEFILATLFALFIFCGARLSS